MHVKYHLIPDEIYEEFFSNLEVISNLSQKLEKTKLAFCDTDIMLTDKEYSDYLEYFETHLKKLNKSYENLKDKMYCGYLDS